MKGLWAAGSGLASAERGYHNNNNKKKIERHGIRRTWIDHDLQVKWRLASGELLLTKPRLEGSQEADLMLIIDHKLIFGLVRV